jgi:uroporphyrin-III C-methyltransferase
VRGIVYLVGAGPGDPGLLTLRGAEILRVADVLVHDRLVAPALLELAPAGAERIDVGKEPGRPGPSQEAICDLLVERARRGLRVVRLKGGDPFVFGRGGEEALACARAGVPVEVVPGVSAATAAPAAAGIPLTHRGLARSFAVVTASGAGGAEVELGPLARAAETLVVLMVAARLEATCRALVAAGRSPGEPAAVVASATTPRQRTVLGTLAELPALARAAGIAPPATLVVGEVVAVAAELDALGELGGRASREPEGPVASVVAAGPRVR